MLNETIVNCFLSVCETLSFTETSKRLFVTQQAVSKNIMQLENDLGLRLINRSPKGISLTDEGIEIEKLFRSHKEQLAKTVSELKNHGLKQKQTINLGFQDYLDLGPELVEASAKFRAENPSVIMKTSRYSPWNLTTKLTDGSLDLIVINTRYLNLTIPHNHRNLFSSRVCLMVSSDNPNITEDSTYYDFINEPYIIDVFEGEDDHALVARAEKEMQLCKLNPSSIITVPNRESAYFTASMGEGIILGSDISQLSRDSRLVKFRTAATTDVCCVWLKSCDKPEIATYAEILAQAYAN